MQCCKKCFPREAMLICFSSRLLTSSNRASRFSKLLCPSVPFTLKTMQTLGAADNDEDRTGGVSNSTSSIADGQTQRTLTTEAAAKRRERPPLRYTEDFATPSNVTLNVIGVVRSPYKVCHPICNNTSSTFCCSEWFTHILYIAHINHFL